MYSCRHLPPWRGGPPSERRDAHPPTMKDLSYSVVHGAVRVGRISRHARVGRQTVPPYTASVAQCRTPALNSPLLPSQVQRMVPNASGALEGARHGSRCGCAWASAAGPRFADLRHLAPSQGGSRGAGSRRVLQCGAQQRALRDLRPLSRALRQGTNSITVEVASSANKRARFLAGAFSSLQLATARHDSWHRQWRGSLRFRGDGVWLCAAGACPAAPCGALCPPTCSRLTVSRGALAPSRA